MLPPAGWYPDPYAAVPGAERYWDGQQWLAQTRHTAPASAPSWQAPTGGAPQWAAPVQQPPASWGSRLAAAIVDSIPVLVVGMVTLGALGYFDLVGRVLSGGAGTESLDAFLQPLGPQSIIVAAVSGLVQLVYTVGFHVAKGQTPGKMLLHIRVRLEAEDRNPTLRAALVRWLVQLGGPQLLSALPLIGFAAGCFTIADHLWPLWDAKAQALHDKAARTLVVRTG